MSSPMDFLTECYYKESLETIKKVYRDLNKENVNMEELLEGFKNMYRPLNNMKVQEKVAPKVSKPRAPRVQKELTEEEKCIATKKDGTRCKGKKLPTGKNPELCSLHNNAISKSKVTIKPKEVPEITCAHVFTKGQNKDKKCVREPLANDTKCKLHSDGDLQVPSSSKKSSISGKKQVEKKLSEEIIETEFEEDDLGLEYKEEYEEVYDDEENF